MLAHLLPDGFRGKVKLVYIDPPFDRGAGYVRKVSLRGVNNQPARREQLEDRLPKQAENDT